MKFLITNDDGWTAQGLRILAEVVQEFGEVWIVAPELPMSGISHQITFEQPLKLVEHERRVFSLSGTPADCVRIATTQLNIEFDWIFSGINNGANLGTDIYVSGTVAATREAAIHGCRSIAFSQYRRKFQLEYDWAKTRKLATQVLPSFIDQMEEHRPGTAININFPDQHHLADGELPFEGEVNVINCDVDRNPLPAEYRLDADGHFVYCSKYDQRPRSPGSDVEICFSGSISVSKLKFE